MAARGKPPQRPLRISVASAVMAGSLRPPALARDGPAPRGADPAETREGGDGGEQTVPRISTGLRAAGRTFEAETVARGESRLTLVPAPFLKSWRIIQVEHIQGPHPVLFHVAQSRSVVHLLTGDPAAFSKVGTADAGTVSDLQTAVELAKVFLTTTRPAGGLTYLVRSVNEIRWTGNLRAAEARHRARVIRWYGQVIKPLTATPSGDHFYVVAYVVQNQQLQRRTLIVNANGAAKEQVETLVPDLPTPSVV
jgi:hypothetical protein